MTLAEQFEQVFAQLGYKTSISVALAVVGLIACRIIPMCIMSPFLGGEQVDGQIRVAVGMLLSIVMFPAVTARIETIPTQPGIFVILVMKEVFIGFCLAFIVSFVFEAARIAGNVVDVASGAQMAQIMAPLIQQQSTIYSTLKLIVATALFLTLNGHHVVIDALADSLLILPIDRFPTFPRGMFAFFDVLLRTFGDMLKIGMVLSGPGLIAAFVTDFAIGMIDPVAPQLQVFFVAMAIKPMVATMMMFLVFFLVMERIKVEFGHMLTLLREALRLLV